MPYLVNRTSSPSLSPSETNATSTSTTTSTSTATTNSTTTPPDINHENDTNINSSDHRLLTRPLGKKSSRKSAASNELLAQILSNRPRNLQFYPEEVEDKGGEEKGEEQEEEEVKEREEDDSSRHEVPFIEHLETKRHSTNSRMGPVNFAPTTAQEEKDPPPVEDINLENCYQQLFGHEEPEEMETIEAEKRNPNLTFTTLQNPISKNASTTFPSTVSSSHPSPPASSVAAATTTTYRTCPSKSTSTNMTLYRSRDSSSPDSRNSSTASPTFPIRNRTSDTEQDSEEEEEEEFITPPNDGIHTLFSTKNKDIHSIAKSIPPVENTSHKIQNHDTWKRSMNLASPSGRNHDTDDSSTTASTTSVRAVNRSHPTAMGKNTRFTEKDAIHPNPEQQGHHVTDLHHLLYSQKWDQVLNLLRTHPQSASIQNVNEKDNLPLHIALQVNAPFAVIQALVKAYPKGCSTFQFNIKTHSPLALAIQWEGKDKEKIIQLIFDQDPSMIREKTEQEATIIHVLLEHQPSLRIVQHLCTYLERSTSSPSLLRFGQDLDGDEEEEKKAPIVKLSKKKKKNRKAKKVCEEMDEQGQLPLHVAIEYKCPADVIQYIYELNPHAVKIRRKPDGFTPLHIALSAGCTKPVLELLLQNEEGRSALFIESKDGNYPLHLLFSPTLIADYYESLDEDFSIDEIHQFIFDKLSRTDGTDKAAKLIRMKNREGNVIEVAQKYLHFQLYPKAVLERMRNILEKAKKMKDEHPFECSTEEESICSGKKDLSSSIGKRKRG